MTTEANSTAKCYISLNVSFSIANLISCLTHGSTFEFEALRLWIGEHTVKKRVSTCKLGLTHWLVSSCCGRWQLSQTRDVILPRSTASSVAWFGVLSTSAIGISCGSSGWLQVSIYSTVSGVATCCGYSRTHVRTLVQGWWWAGRGWQQGGRGFLWTSSPRSVNLSVYMKDIWSSSHLSRKAHHILLL